jgi:hypothetical protein
MASNDASTSSTSSPSSIGTVVAILDQSGWKKLHKGHALAVLHATYWGKKNKGDDHSEVTDKDADEDEDIVIGCHTLKTNNNAMKIGNKSDGIWVRVSVLNCIQNGPLNSQTG